MQKILISGASIAGPALAYWLRHYGFSPMLVERAPGPRPGGQAIDIRGVALEVVARMGLREAVTAARTRHKGMSVLDADGNETFRSTEMTFSAGRFDSGDIEILRDDFSALLRGAIPDVPCVYDDQIIALTQHEGGVDVTFEKGAPRTFDLVIGADGLASRVRRLAFDAEQHLHPLDIAIGIFTTPNVLDLDNWQIAVQAETVGALIFPVRDNSELRVFLGGDASGRVMPTDVAAQKAFIAEQCADLKWEIPKLIALMHEAQEFWFGTVAQLRMPHWSNGRVTLVGDAGYCPSPMSGQGTSLALVGAYILAQELSRTVGDHVAAFARCEARMRPFVEINQALAIRENPDDRPSQEEIDAAKNAIVLDESGDPGNQASRAGGAPRLV